MVQGRSERSDVTFEIVSHLGVLAEKKDGWTKELNLVSWNGGNPPKFDIRDWSPDHKSMNKGITLFEPEMRKVAKLYQEFSNAKTVAENRDKRNAAAEAGIRAGEEERAKEVQREKDAEREREAERERQAEPAKKVGHADYNGSDGESEGAEESELLEDSDDRREKDMAGVMLAASESEYAAENVEQPF